MIKQIFTVALLITSLLIAQEKYKPWIKGERERYSNMNQLSKVLYPGNSKIDVTYYGLDLRITINPNYLNTDQLKQELNETKGRLEAVDGNIPAFMAGVATVIQKANKEGFEVDPNQLIDLALRNRTSPDVAYYQLTYDERTKRAAEQREKDIKEAEERGRRSALADRPSPDHLRPAGPSVIDRIRGKGVEYPTSRRDIVDAAVEEFRKMNQEGLGA